MRPDSLQPIPFETPGVERASPARAPASDGRRIPDPPQAGKPFRRGRVSLTAAKLARQAAEVSHAD